MLEEAVVVVVVVVVGAWIEEDGAVVVVGCFVVIVDVVAVAENLVLPVVEMVAVELGLRVDDVLEVVV